jgi:hypothetical protein
MFFCCVCPFGSFFPIFACLSCEPMSFCNNFFVAASGWVSLQNCCKFHFFFNNKWKIP